MVGANAGRPSLPGFAVDLEWGRLIRQSDFSSYNSDWPGGAGPLALKAPNAYSPGRFRFRQRPRSSG